MRLLGRKRGDDTGGSAAKGEKYEKLPVTTRAITFYAEDGSAWPHFAPILAEITGRHGREVAYLTSSQSDPVLAEPPPGVHASFVAEGIKRSFAFQTMEAGVVVATVPQLGTKLLPKSRRATALGTQYLYVFHSMASTHMIYEPDGFDHFDAVLCVGPYMLDEIRRREELHGLPAKELVEHGYGRLDSIVAARAVDAAPANDPPVVLVAPSWGPTCLFETCGAEVVEAILATGAEVIARPHPMTAKRTPHAIPALDARFRDHPRFTLETDVASQASLQRADVMVSDWSGAALEFAFGLERPVLFVDVPRKVNNPQYEELGIEPFEAAVRARIGAVVAPDDTAAIAPALADLVARRGEWVEAIRATRDANVFHLGRSGAVAADTIVERADRFLARQGRA